MKEGSSCERCTYHGGSLNISLGRRCLVGVERCPWTVQVLGPWKERPNSFAEGRWGRSPAGKVYLKERTKKNFVSKIRSLLTGCVKHYLYDSFVFLLTLDFPSSEPASRFRIEFSWFQFISLVPKSAFCAQKILFSTANYDRKLEIGIVEFVASFGDVVNKRNGWSLFRIIQISVSYFYLVSTRRPLRLVTKINIWHSCYLLEPNPKSDLKQV